MTYGVIITVGAEPALYDEMHAAALRRTGGTLDGLLLHVARETVGGFQIIEVWDTKEQCERANREVVEPLMAAMPARSGPPEQTVEKFDPRGLVLAGTSIAW